MTDKDTATKEAEAAAAAEAEAKAKEEAKAKDGMVPQAQLDSEVAKRTALEKDMEDLASTLLAEVPDHLKDIIPEGTAKQKVDWYRKAKETGIFKKSADVPPTDGGAKPKGEAKHSDVDLDKLPPIARMAHGYGTTKH